MKTFLSMTIIVFMSAAVCSQEDITTTRLTENLFLLYDPAYHTANIVALAGEEGVLLLDAGFRPTSAKLKSEVAKLNSGPVKKIVVSHPHGDHTGAIAEFAETAEIVCHERAKSRMTKYGTDIHAVSDDLSFTFNGKTITCIAFPDGHSPYDIVIHIPEEKWAFLGDLYLSESFPLIDTESG